MVINATAGVLIALAILGHGALGRISAPPSIVNPVAWVIIVFAAAVEVLAVFAHGHL